MYVKFKKQYILRTCLYDVFNCPGFMCTKKTRPCTWSQLENYSKSNGSIILMKMTIWKTNTMTKCIYVRGHPFMTSTRRGVRLRWAHVDGGRWGPAPCGRPHRKLKLVHWRHTVFFSCKEVGVFFYQNFIFGQKKVDIFLRYKLVI